MGQPITVTARAGVSPDVMHFELNRSLTGMQIERYSSGSAITGQRPPDELARRLFALPGVTGVTVYSSTVTVTGAAWRWPELRGAVEDTIVHLFIYYREGQSAAPALSQPAPAEGAPASASS